MTDPWLECASCGRQMPRPATLPEGWITDGDGRAICASCTRPRLTVAKPYHRPAPAGAEADS